MSRGERTPPAWAEWLFMALLPADRAETESGDLLEVYRDEQLPARGRAAADWWYVRQVAAVFAHNYWFWLVALMALFVIGDVANTYRLAGRAHGGPIVAVALIFAASVQGGWRTARIGGGLAAGAATSTLLWLFMAAWWMTTWYPFSFAQQVQPYWVDAWHSSAASDETFAHWIFWDNVGATIVSGVALNAFGLAVGFAGGVGGALARRLHRV
jgi:hypothetical protein